MTMDGIPELVTGWSDGTVDVRKDRANGSGEILIRDKFPCAIAGLVQGDYRNDGTNMILAVSVEGEGEEERDGMDERDQCTRQNGGIT